MKFLASLGTAGAIAYFVVVIAAIYGYFANIIKIVGMVGGEITTLLFIRVVGVFAAPLGAIMGFF